MELLAEKINLIMFSIIVYWAIVIKLDISLNTKLVLFKLILLILLNHKGVNYTGPLSTVEVSYFRRWNICDFCYLWNINKFNLTYQHFLYWIFLWQDCLWLTFLFSSIFVGEKISARYVFPFEFSLLVSRLHYYTV